jgi:uncharacterized protein (DUF488 family)
MHTIAPHLHLPKSSLSHRTTVFHSLGYEQSQLPDYLKRLQDHDVSMVVDVREVPVSRKAGFSKNKLREALNGIDIKYLHIQTLGAPREIRDNLRSGGSWLDYVKQYTSRVLECRRQDIELLNHLVVRERVALLCFERDPRACHRSLVAEEMVKSSSASKLKIEHICY